LLVSEEEVPLDRRTPLWRRAWSIVAGSSMALVTGAVAATLIGFGASWIVITLSHMLKK
jgi:hypothetical protein